MKRFFLALAIVAVPLTGFASHGQSGATLTQAKKEIAAAKAAMDKAKKESYLWTTSTAALKKAEEAYKLRKYDTAYKEAHIAKEQAEISYKQRQIEGKRLGF